MRKHPFRFNLFGQAKWLGRIYGDLSASLLLSRQAGDLFRRLRARPVPDLVRAAVLADRASCR